MAETTDNQQLEGWLKNIPSLFQGKFRKQSLKAATKSSMRAAVEAKCADCTNWQNTEVRECTVVTCPLWQYRPRFRGPKDDIERRERLLSIAKDLSKAFSAQSHA